MREVAIRLDDAHRREFRRVLGFSLLAHVLGLGLLILAPGVPNFSPPAAISVSLVAPPSSLRAPAAPSPAAPKPKPRPPKPAPVVLPAQPSQPKPRPKPEQPPPKPEPAPERDYADVMKELRSELAEPAPEAAVAPEAAAQPAGPPSAGVPGGQPVSPEVAAWMRKARIHIRAHWAVPANFRMLDLVTVVEVELDATGSVGGTPRVLKRSGNPYYDDNVVRGIQKASPLPAPPEAGRWTFNMLSSEGW